MCFVINDEDFCRDGFVSPEIECVFVCGFLLTVRDTLGVVICREFENLKIILFGFHAVNAVPEDYLCQYGDCFTDSSGAVSWVTEHFCHLLCGSVVRFVSKTKAPSP